MNFIASLSLIRRRIPLIAVIGTSFALDAAIAQTSPIQVSASGEIVAEFSSTTAPGNPQLMAASAIKEITAGLTLCGVYVSRDGGNAWSEVPAWPDTGFQPVFDPWVAIGVDGTIHAVGIARTTEGGRAVYTQSRDQGVSWSPALGGDYWSFTWKAVGWLSMWVDPVSGAGPGVLLADPVTAPN
jgi:hypothetical protein